MTAAAILVEAERRGLKLRTDGTMVYFCPQRAADPVLLEAMCSRKAELIARPQAAKGTGVGPWQPPGDITRHCRGCNGGLQPAELDGTACFTCRWSLEHLAVRRIQ